MEELILSGTAEAMIHEMDHLAGVRIEDLKKNGKKNTDTKDRAAGKLFPGERCFLMRHRDRVVFLIQLSNKFANRMDQQPADRCLMSLTLQVFCCDELTRQKKHSKFMLECGTEKAATKKEEDSEYEKAVGSVAVSHDDRSRICAGGGNDGDHPVDLSHWQLDGRRHRG